MAAHKTNCLQLSYPALVADTSQQIQEEEKKKAEQGKGDFRFLTDFIIIVITIIIPPLRALYFPSPTETAKLSHFTILTVYNHRHYHHPSFESIICLVYFPSPTETAKTHLPAGIGAPPSF